MSICETVKIKQGDDYAIINKSDFDPKVHEMYGKKKAPAKKKPVKRTTKKK